MIITLVISSRICSVARAVPIAVIIVLRLAFNFGVSNNDVPLEETVPNGTLRTLALVIVYLISSAYHLPKCFSHGYPLARIFRERRSIARATRRAIRAINWRARRIARQERKQEEGWLYRSRAISPARTLRGAKSDLFNPSLRSDPPLAPTSYFTALFNHLLRRERLAPNFRAFLFRETREHRPHPRPPSRSLSPLPLPSVASTLVVVARSISIPLSGDVAAACVVLERMRAFASSRPSSTRDAPSIARATGGRRGERTGVIRFFAAAGVFFESSAKPATAPLSRLRCDDGSPITPVIHVEFLRRHGRRRSLILSARSCHAAASSSFFVASTTVHRILIVFKDVFGDDALFARNPPSTVWDATAEYREINIGALLDPSQKEVRDFGNFYEILGFLIFKGRYSVYARGYSTEKNTQRRSNCRYLRRQLYLVVAPAKR